MSIAMRGAATVLVGGILLTGAGYVVLPAAQAAPPDVDPARVIGLSADGLTWAESLDAPLFDSDVRWVPGDVRSARFWVRNQAPTAGDVTVRFSPSVALSGVDLQSLRVLARAGDRSWTEVVGSRGGDLLAGDGLAVGQATSVDLLVEMRHDAPNTSMVLSTGLDLDVVMADAAVGPDGTYPLLPHTGSLVPEWAAPLAGGSVVVGVGLLLAAARRRRADYASHPVHTA